MRGSRRSAIADATVKAAISHDHLDEAEYGQLTK